MLSKILSTATTLSLLTTTLLANSLESVVNDSKISSEIKFHHASSNLLGFPNSDLATGFGGSFGLVTGDFYGFKLGATLQAMGLINEDTTHKIFRDNLDGEGVVLSELYLDYTIKDTNLKLGRQFIYTPLVSTALKGFSSESMIKDAFEAYIITNSSLPDTTILAGYIHKYQNQTDYMGDIGDFEKDGLEDGAYTIHIKNSSFPNLTLQAQYLKINDFKYDIDIYYAQADYKLGAHTLSAQYAYSKNEAMGSELEDGAVWGVRAMGPLGVGKLGFLTAFTSSYKDGDSYPGLGKGTSDTLFTAMPVGGDGITRRGNADTIVAALTVPIEKFTFIPYIGKSFVNPNSKNPSSQIGDAIAYGLAATYKHSEKFDIKANWEHVRTQNHIPNSNSILSKKDSDTMKLYMTYSF